MKRKGETLTEFLAAVTVFGLMVSGIFEFIANQTENLADIKNKDDMMYGAQVVCNWTINNVQDTSGNTVYNHSLLPHINHSVTAGLEGTYHYYTDSTPILRIDAIHSPIRKIEREIVSFDWDRDTHTLTVKKNGQSLSFQLQP